MSLMPTDGADDAVNAVAHTPDLIRLLLATFEDAHDLANAGMATALWSSIVAREDALWLPHCKRFGLERSPSPRDSVARYMRTRCCECLQPTPYVFTLRRVRLCERCELANTREYGLVSAIQLRFESGPISLLSEAQQCELLRSLPSLHLAGCEWHVRSQVLDAADRALAEGEADGAALSERLTGPREVDDEADQAASGAARRGPERRVRRGDAEAREAQKEQKKRVKAEQRAKRQGLVPEPARVPPGAFPEYKGKRASVRQHRAAAPVKELDRAFRRLEARFGAGLAGLSGLALADEGS